MRANSIEIATEACAAMMRLAYESSDGLETGGILLGRGPDGRGVISIEIAGERGPRAERRADYFLRDLEHAQMLAATAWERSRAVWVGEWHTHPKGPAEPSTSDLATYRNLLGSAELQFESFVSLILRPDEQLAWRRPHMSRWLLELAASPDVAEPTGRASRSAPAAPAADGALGARRPPEAGGLLCPVHRP